MINFTTEEQIRPAIALALFVGIVSVTAIGYGQANGLNPGANLQDPAGTQSPDAFPIPGIPDPPMQDPLAAPTGPMGQFPVTPRPMVDEKYAGWRQASDGREGQQLDETLRAHWVMADESGQLSGLVYGIEGADLGNFEVHLLNKGNLVTSTTPGEDGSFSFPNVRQGCYALVGWGDNAFFAFSFNILKFNEAYDENVPTELFITAVPNETTINTDWIRYFATGVRFPIYGIYETGETEDDPPRLYGYEGQSLFLPAARPATSVSSHQVIPTADGRLVGRVHQMNSRNGRPVELRNTRIMLLQNDDVYAAVTTDSYGVFEFENIPTGEYSCVAVGQDGLGCIGINVGESLSDFDDGLGESQFAPISFCMTTSETTGWLNNLAIETAYQRIISRPRVQYEEYQEPYQPTCSDTPYRLRPGGYRPPPRSEMPPEKRLINRFNNRINRIFFGS